MKIDLFSLAELILKDEAQYLASSGFEKKISQGFAVVPEAFEYEQSLQLQGDGGVSFLSRRASGDIGGREAGQYQINGEQNTFVSILKIVASLKDKVGEPAAVEPGSARVLLRLVGAGHHALFTFGLSSPDFLESVKPLLKGLEDIEKKITPHPVWTVALKAQAKVQLNSLGLHLTFVNRGKEGIWIVHPLNLDPKSPRTFIYAVVGQKPILLSGVTPLPMKTQRIPLQGNLEATEYLWLPAGEQRDAFFKAAIPTGLKGPCLGRVAYGNYQGSDEHAGCKHFRGAVFSTDFEFVAT